MTRVGTGYGVLGPRWGAVLVSGLLGCAAGGSQREGFEAWDDPSGFDSMEAELDSEGDDEELRLDVGGEELRDGCRYVDLLFVIDNSGSMCPAQEGLASVLPELVEAMFDALPPDTDIHVGLTTTSFSHGGTVQQSNCAALASEQTIAQHYVLDEELPYNGYQGRLFRHQGKPFFEANTSDPTSRAELSAWFPEAVLSIGCGGGAFEFTAAAAGYALHPANEDHNAGFIRDAGGALVIFALSDEVDLSMEGIPAYRQMVLDAKAGCGGEDCVVTSGLLATNCVPDANPVIWQFLNAFGKTPIWGDISDFDSYTAVLSDALAMAIGQTCESIPPVG